jgi:hypothetical protein
VLAVPRLTVDDDTTAVVGTVNALLNVPVAVTGTVTVGANATLLNLIVAVLPGIKWVPVTVTDWPATPLDVDSEIAGVVTVNAADAICVPSDTATVPIPDGDPGTVNLTLTGIPPADVDVTVTGDVVTGVPLNVNVSTCVAAKLVPDTVTDVPLGPVVGDSVIPDVTVNCVVWLFVPSDIVIV